MDINLGGNISELEYDEELVGGCFENGVIPFVGDGAQPFLYKIGLEAFKNIGAKGGAIFKPRTNQANIIKRLQEAEKAGLICAGIDIDAAAFLTMSMLGQGVSTKTVFELKDLISAVNIPFVIKGIMTPEDACLAVEAGAALIVVSNHGGRITDNHPSTVSVLPGIKKAVDGKVKIAIDGGFRNGEDIFKAIALGADYCMIGRPFSTAVLGGGRKGVQILIKQYLQEFQKIMLLTGAASVKSINQSMIIT